VLATLRARGASFARDLGPAAVTRGLPSDGQNAGRPLTAGPDSEAAAVASALAELVSAGLVSSDGFAGLRAIVRPERGSRVGHALDGAGRWSVLHGDDASCAADGLAEAQAWSYLRRYGVVFRRLLSRETNAVPWRDLTRAYRRLEARGEIRGGRFVSGMSGEQFALPEAVERLREIRRSPAHDCLVTVSAADPLNLTGIITSGERVRAVGANRIVYRHGVAVAALEGEYMRPLAPCDEPLGADVATALTGRRMPPVSSGFVGRAT
jgi:ATP-dependent Lhr-like helicase